MSDPVVLYKTDSHKATITINRPHRRNALSVDVISELTRLFSELKTNPEIHVVILTGAGSVMFSSGADLQDTRELENQGVLSFGTRFEPLVDLIRVMNALGKPIIAKINGNCFAGALGLMLSCDLVIASNTARFATPEIKVGLFPMMIMAQIFRNIGRKKGMELILTGDPISADEAERIGLINYAVPPTVLDDRVNALADKVAGYSPAVLKLGRDAFYTSQDMDFEPGIRYLCSQLVANAMTEDAMEGITSFLQKKRPEWKGC